MPDSHPQLEISLDLCPTDDVQSASEVMIIPIGKVYFISVTSGSAVVEIDDVSTTLRTGCFVYLNPGHMIRILTASEDFKVSMISFYFDFLADFPLLLKADLSDFAGKYPCQQLDDKDMSLIGRYFRFINDRITDDSSGLYVTKGLLFSLILEVSRIYTGQHVTVTVSRTDEMVDNFFSLLHKHFRKEREVKFYADKLCVSDKHLMRSVKKKTGMTIHFWITDFIARESKMMLRSTDMTITEISEKLNFPNSSFFARFFKRHTSMSPTEFRNKYEHP